MKKVLAVVLAAAFVMTAAYSADAQVRNIKVYFDANWTQSSIDCAGPGAGLQTLYVVGNNLNMNLSAAQYQIDYPTSMAWLGDATSAALVIGVSPTGIALNWSPFINAFSSVLLQTATFIWNCNDCNDGNFVFPQAVVVNGYLGDPSPTVLSWPDNLEQSAVGLTSLVCPGTIPVETKTWGSIKALYTE